MNNTTKYITDYYRFVKVAKKAKDRIDCQISTKSYEYFEEIRRTDAQRTTPKKDGWNVGDITLYLRNLIPDTFKVDVRRKTDMMLERSNVKKGESKHVTSIYQPRPNVPYAFGDVHGRKDLLLMHFIDVDYVDKRLADNAVLEVFVLRGEGKQGHTFYQRLINGELTDEMELMREKAKRITLGE